MLCPWAQCYYEKSSTTGNVNYIFAYFFRSFTNSLFISVFLSFFISFIGCPKIVYAHRFAGKNAQWTAQSIIRTLCPVLLCGTRAISSLPSVRLKHRPHAPPPHHSLSFLVTSPSYFRKMITGSQRHPRGGGRGAAGRRAPGARLRLRDNLPHCSIPQSIDGKNLSGAPRQQREGLGGRRLHAGSSWLDRRR